MTLPKRGALFPFFDARRKVEELFSERIHKPWGGRSESTAWQPAVDLYSTDTLYILEADLPGVLPVDIELTLEGNVLQIRGFRHGVLFTQSAQWIRLERAHGEFLRQFTLSGAVDMSRLERHYENGIFRVTIPRVKMTSV